MEWQLGEDKKGEITDENYKEKICDSGKREEMT